MEKDSGKEAEENYASLSPGLGKTPTYTCAKTSAKITSHVNKEWTPLQWTGILARVPYLYPKSITLDAP